MLRKIRIALAIFFWLSVTALFLDFTGVIHTWLGWTAKIQFLPALSALNFIALAVLIIITFLFGRIYCSVICPLGITQDVISWLSGRRKKKRYRFSFSPEKKILRYTFLSITIIGIIIAAVAHTGIIVSLIDPYAIYGRFATGILNPLYKLGNNLLAYFAERADSYAFYSTDVWLKSISSLVISIVMMIIIVVLAWRSGRSYCNNVCPVGTLLGFISRYSLFKINIDKSKCNACGLCSRKCKSSCINGNEHKVDYSRCVACMDCIDTCKHGAISYQFAYGKKGCNAKNNDCNTVRTDNSADNKNSATNLTTEQIGGSADIAKATISANVDNSGTENNSATDTASMSRREMLTATGLLVASTALNAKGKRVDGGLAAIVQKEAPKREHRILQPGAKSERHLAIHCTACQLCIAACPNNVLRPSADLKSLMEPEASYERGYCRPECNRCSEVCPAGAIHKVSVAEKSSLQIGHAVWIKENCVPLTDGVECGNCARHCPSGAITMVPSEPGNAFSPKIPSINTEVCIGCGACENLCPASPFSAIYVEGNDVQRFI